MKFKIVESIRQQGNIELIYKTLLEGRTDDLEKYNMRWRTWLGNPEISLEKSIDLTGRIFPAASLKSQHYKMLFNLYHTPLKMMKWGGQHGGKCCRCGKDSADIVHVFFACAVLDTLKESIERFLSEITGDCVKISQSMMLLGIGEDFRQGQLLYEHRYPIFMATVVAQLAIASL